MGNEKLADALQDFGFAIKSLQLYPPTSPLVRGASERCYTSLVPILQKGGLTLDVMPGSLRHGDSEIAPGSTVVGQLAKRLHGHGVARIHLDPRLEADSLRRLAEMVAVDRHQLEEDGGFESVFNDDRPRGVHLDFLELDRLFEGDSPATTEDIWEALLDGFRLHEQIEEIDWVDLAQNLERLQDFVSWVGDNVDQIAERTGYENVDVFRFVLDRLGGIAASLGTEHVDFLVLAVRRIFDRIDPELLVDLLAEPLEVELPEDTQASSEPSTMSLSAFLGAEQPGQPEAATAGDGGARKTIDITQVIACGLDPAQAEELILHTMRGHEKSSTRLYGLFSRLMDGREEQAVVAQRVHRFIEQEMGESDEGSGFLDAWPRLSDVLEGEAPERFVSAGYEATMQHLLADDSLTGTWPIDSIRDRFAEMRTDFVAQRRAYVVVDVLEIEDDDVAYAKLADELEGALRESIAHDRHGLALRILRTFRRHAAEGGRSEAQRRTAAEISERFYNPGGLGKLLGESLGKVREETETLSEIIDLGGAEIVPVLLDLLADEDNRRVRQRLLKILAGLGEPVTEASARRLDDQRWYVVRNLVLLMGEGGDQRRIDQIAPLMQHDDARVRQETARALIKLGSTDAVDLLLAATEDEDAAVRLLAVHGLGFYRSDAGIEKLRDYLRLPNFKGQNTETIQTAAVALGRLGDKSSAAKLARLSKKPWFYLELRSPVRQAARWAVRAISGEQVGPPPEPRKLRSLRPPWGRSRR